MNTSEPEEHMPSAAVERITYLLIAMAGLISCIEAYVRGGAWDGPPSIGLVMMLWAAWHMVESFVPPARHA